MDKDEYGVSLIVTSNDLSLHDISQLFGIEAETKLIKGQPTPIPQKLHEQDVWILDSRSHISKHKPLDEHIEFVANILARVSNKTAGQFKPGEIVFALGCYEHSSNPGAHLDSAVIALLSKFKADVDIDFFAVGE